VNLLAAELVGLVTGGRSGERDRSLLSAEAVGEALGRQGLKFVRLDPCERDFADRILEADVAFLAIAGQWAEDGKLQAAASSHRSTGGRHPRNCSRSDRSCMPACRSRRGDLFTMTTATLMQAAQTA
jgi:hypothetical protein